MLRETLYEVELSSTFRNGLQKLKTPLHSVSPLQQLLPQFYGSVNKGAGAQFPFFVPRQVAEKIAECNRDLKVACKQTKNRVNKKSFKLTTEHHENPC